MARVLILRPIAEAGTTAAELRILGHEPLILPLNAIVPLDAPLPAAAEGFGGFIVTSAHAVPALAAAFPCDERPVFAVGERTAEALSAAGFPDVRAGKGGGEALAEAAIPVAAKGGLQLLYAAGRVRTSGLEDRLKALGVGFAVWEVYDTRPLDPGPAEVEAAIGQAAPDAVLLLSVGQAEAYVRLTAKFFEGFSPTSRLLCLSNRIADALPMELRGSAEISGSMSLPALFDRLR